MNNNISINLDKTYKVKDYNYSISGKIDSENFEILRPINNNFLTKEIKKIYLSNFQMKSVLNKKKINFNGQGKYSFNNLDFLKINFEKLFSKINYSN